MSAFAVYDAGASSAVPSNAPAPRITGVRKRIVKTRIWGRIIWIALRSYRSPVRALRTLQRMVAARSRVQSWVTTRYAHAGGRWFWNMYAPGFPSRAFDAYVKRELDRVEPFRGAPPALQTVVFAITKRCALQCEHCCEWAALNGPEALSGDDLRRIVERLRARGTAQLFLSGGEPLRRFGDVLAIAAAASADVDVWILSSGQGLTPERARRLRNAGLTGVSLSVDHWDAAWHDRFRGRAGTFDEVVRAAANAVEAGLLVAFSLCPTRDFVTADNLQRYAETARAMGASFIQLLEPKAIGHWEGQDVALSGEQQALLEAFAERLNASRECRHLPAVSYPDATSRHAGCHGAGDRYLYVDTDGAVHPCPFCRAPAGRALDGDLDDTIAALQATGCLTRAE